MIRALIRRVLDGDEPIYECRSCGRTVDEAVERCPECGSTEIARYDIED